MKTAKQYSYISLAQATDIVAAIGDKVTTLVTGPMGCGKSSMLNALAKRYPDHHAIYADCTTMDVGDIAMPKFMNVNGHDVVSYVPNTLFGTHLEKPIILLLDELGKASKSVTNALLRIMLERKINDKVLPEGSIVFATTNRGIEGLGDNIPAHVRNRLCQINITKPTAMQWVEDFGLAAGVHHIILGAVIEFPSMLEDDIHVEDPNSNHYIFHPKQPRTSFVTPRSLEKASDILKATEHSPDDVVLHSLIGVIGEAGAMDVLTLRKLDNTLPSWEQIIRDPEGTKIPKGAAAACMTTSKAVQRVERDTFGAWMIYVERLPKEVQALFARSVMRSAKVGVATTHKGFSSWAAKNSFLFS
jgi:hypothetical protein